MKAVVNGKIVLKNGVLENKVIVFDKQIIDICDEVPTNCEIIDAKGNYVCPGLIAVAYTHLTSSCASLSESNIVCGYFDIFNICSI